MQRPSSEIAPAAPWDRLSQSERSEVEVVIKCARDEVRDLKPPYQSLYNAILGSKGARDLFAGTKANEAFLGNHGTCRFFAAAATESGHVYATDGGTIFLLERESLGGRSLASVPVAELQAACSAPFAEMNLEDFAEKNGKRRRSRKKGIVEKKG